LRYYHKAEAVFEAQENRQEGTQLIYQALLKKIALHYLQNKQYEKAILYAEKIRALDKNDTTIQYILKSVQLLTTLHNKK
jgi:hypothetical protein